MPAGTVGCIERLVQVVTDVGISGPDPNARDRWISTLEAMLRTVTTDRHAVAPSTPDSSNVMSAPRIPVEVRVGVAGVTAGTSAQGSFDNRERCVANSRSTGSDGRRLRDSVVRSC